MRTPDPRLIFPSEKARESNVVIIGFRSHTPQGGDLAPTPCC
jgi:hypothetical protein